jgi:hypothetical protein
VVQDLEHGKLTIEVSMQKALLTHAKMKLRILISKFSSFIHYVTRLFILNTKIECITTILLVTDFGHVTKFYF